MHIHACPINKVRSSPWAKHLRKKIQPKVLSYHGIRMMGWDDGFSLFLDAVTAGPGEFGVSFSLSSSREVLLRVSVRAWCRPRARAFDRTKNIQQQAWQMWRRCPVPRRNSMGISHPCLFLRLATGPKVPMTHDFDWNLQTSFKLQAWIRQAVMISLQFWQQGQSTLLLGAQGVQAMRNTSAMKESQRFSMEACGLERSLWMIALLLVMVGEGAACWWNYCT